MQKVTLRRPYLYKQEDLSLQSLCCRRIYTPGKRHEETFFREVSLSSYVSTAHGDGRGQWRNGDAAAPADVVPTAAPPAPAAAS